MPFFLSPCSLIAIRDLKCHGFCFCYLVRIRCHVLRVGVRSFLAVKSVAACSSTLRFWGRVEAPTCSPDYAKVTRVRFTHLGTHKFNPLLSLRGIPNAGVTDCKSKRQPERFYPTPKPFLVRHCLRLRAVAHTNAHMVIKVL